MKRLYPGLGALVLLAFFSLAAPSYGQTVAATTKPTVPPRYDVSKEVTLTAVVQNIPQKSSAGLTQESFLVLQTRSGLINASVTRFTLTGKGSISITQGEQIQATGVMTRFQDKQIFVIRTLVVGGRTYQIRSQSGFPREHPGAYGVSATESKGGQL
jgi:hypothetical protein